jgi:tryptophanyl-tRNA synthetase
LPDACPGEAKDIEGSTLFEIYKAFVTPTETKAIAIPYADGIGCCDMKQLLVEYINDYIKRRAKNTSR